MRQEQIQEVTKLCAKLTALKSETIKKITTIQTTNITGQTELKGIIENLEAQLNFEHTTRESNKWWYKGMVDKMVKKHQDSVLQCAMIKQRLSKKDAQVQELLKTIFEMSDSMEQMKEQIGQVPRGTAQSSESGPTFAAGIPDAGSTANAPRFPIGGVGDDGNVTPLEPMIAIAADTQFVNVEVPISDIAFNVPYAS